MTDEETKTAVLDELIRLLKLEKIEENIFRGQSQDMGFGNIFGGQVLGQALSAMIRTVPEERLVHSLHGYFLRPGDPKMPIIYQVDPIRDGRSFTTRRAVAIQKGRAIFSVSASFQKLEPGFDHQDTMPDVPGPDGIESELERRRRFQDRIPEPIRAKLTCERPIDIRVVNPTNPFNLKKQEPYRYAWFKTIGKLPDDPMLHRYLLAYSSDFGLVETSMYPHAHSYWERSMQVASLDHAMWFHRDFRMDDWLLYSMHSSSAGGARGLNFGQVYDRSGKMVASVAQEGLIRYRGE